MSQALYSNHFGRIYDEPLVYNIATSDQCFVPNHAISTLPLAIIRHMVKLLPIALSRTHSSFTGDDFNHRRLIIVFFVHS